MVGILNEISIYEDLYIPDSVTYSFIIKLLYYTSHVLCKTYEIHFPSVPTHTVKYFKMSSDAKLAQLKKVQNQISGMIESGKSYDALRLIVTISNRYVNIIKYI